MRAAKIENGDGVMLTRFCYFLSTCQAFLAQRCLSTSALVHTQYYDITKRYAFFLNVVEVQKKSSAIVHACT
jgi:hypothetical protein